MTLKNELDGMKKDDLIQTRSGESIPGRFDVKHSSQKKFDIKIIRVSNERPLEGQNQSQVDLNQAERKNRFQPVAKHSQSIKANVTLSVEASAQKPGISTKQAIKSHIDHKSSIPSHVTADQRSQSPLLANRYSDHQNSNHVLKPKMVHDSQNSMHYLKITIGRSKSNKGSQSELLQ